MSDHNETRGLDLDRLDDWARGIVDLTGEEARAVVDEVRALRRWKAEALPVMDGLQELGGALGLPLGTLITGRQANDAALDLRNAAANG